MLLSHLDNGKVWMQIQLSSPPHFQQYLNQEWSINYLYCQGSHLGDIGTKGSFISRKENGWCLTSSYLGLMPTMKMPSCNSKQ